jgi:hypothetical protein
VYQEKFRAKRCAICRRQFLSSAIRRQDVLGEMPQSSKPEIEQELRRPVPLAQSTGST